MKKILLATTLAILSSSALAEQGTYYLRADAGGSTLPETNIPFSDGLRAYTLKYKPSTHFVGSIGAGSYIMDKFRAEIVLSRHFNAIQGPKNPFSAAFGPSTLYSSTKLYTNILSLTAKGLADIYDFGVGQIFVGAGLGAAEISGKAKATLSIAGGVSQTQSQVIKYKKVTNFTYALTLGSGLNVTEGVKLDVAYSYNDYGKITKFKEGDGTMKYKLSSHDITAGIRVSL